MAVTEEVQSSLPGSSLVLMRVAIEESVRGRALLESACFEILQLLSFSL